MTFNDTWFENHSGLAREDAAKRADLTSLGRCSWNPEHVYWTPRQCDGCGSSESAPLQLKRCARCKVVRYCSDECQRAAWAEHKHTCVPCATPQPGPSPEPSAEHEPDVPFVEPVARLLADLCCGDEDAALVSLAQVSREALMAPLVLLSATGSAWHSLVAVASEMRLGRARVMMELKFGGKMRGGFYGSYPAPADDDHDAFTEIVHRFAPGFAMPAS